MNILDTCIKVRGKLNCIYDYKYTRKDGSGRKCGRSKIPGIVYRVQNNRQFYYTGFVPISINNPEGQPYRDKLKAAVLAWQNLSLTVKEYWRKISTNDKNHSGYNLFIRDYMLN